ncbi:MAG: beta-hydroxyacyl-ACP dehydratase [Planctomycetota bacterium]|nr:beta-hydroxyacyl-ACP dehydratase [Planctomycetota bacterium]
MRWIWIDRVLELERGKRLVAIKNITMAEDHLHDHFPEVRDDAGQLVHPATPVMPGSLVIEGMAQTAGILVGHAEDFREKVVLAKVTRATLDRDATPGTTIRHTAELAMHSEQGAATKGTVDLFDHAHPDAGWVTIGKIDLMFSHLDQNIAGTEFPDHNFVFSETFRTLLVNSGIGCDF